MDLERELSRALERKAAPPGFADGVMKKIKEDRQARLPVLHWRGWRAVAAATLFTAFLGGWAAHEAEKRREGERAKEEVLLALRITSEKLADARDHVNDIGTNP